MYSFVKNPNDNHCGEPEKKTNLKICCHFKISELTIFSTGQTGGKTISIKIENETPKIKPKIKPLSKFIGKIVAKFI
jgi:hypothetical protein